MDSKIIVIFVGKQNLTLNSTPMSSFSLLFIKNTSPLIIDHITPNSNRIMSNFYLILLFCLLCIQSHSRPYRLNFRGKEPTITQRIVIHNCF